MRIIALADAKNRGKSTSIKIAKEKILNDLELSNSYEIKEKFENGVTFLHYSFNKFDFAQDKENIELSVL